MPMQLYCPPNKQSKAYLVLDAARKGWPDSIDITNYARGDGPAMFWGFVGENFSLMKDLERRKKDFYFADMPYFGRWNGDNNATHYWRITKNEAYTITDRRKDLSCSIKLLNHGRTMVDIFLCVTVHQQ